MTNEDVIITSPNTIEAVIDAAGVVSVQLDKTGYTENEASVMAGKAAIAAAISNKGITADKTDSFRTLSYKINDLQTTTKKSFKQYFIEKDIKEPSSTIQIIE